MSSAAEKVYREIKNQGTQKGVIDKMQTRSELYETLGYEKYEEKLDGLYNDNKHDRNT